MCVCVCVCRYIYSDKKNATPGAKKPKKVKKDPRANDNAEVHLLDLYICV